MAFQFRSRGYYLEMDELTLKTPDATGELDFLYCILQCLQFTFSISKTILIVSTNLPHKVTSGYQSFCLGF